MITVLLVLFIFLGISSCGTGGDLPIAGQPSQFATQTAIIKKATNDPSQSFLPTHTQITTETEESLLEINDPIPSEVNEQNKPEITDLSQSFELCSPLASEEIEELWEIVSDPYNPPPPGKEDRHQGVDFSYYRREERVGIEGEEIHAILPGIVVAKVINRLPYGNMVIIETPRDLLPLDLLAELKINRMESLYHLYAHMKEEPLVDLMDQVECGQPLGAVGLTGYNVVNAHLHLETRIGPRDTVLDTMVFYDTSATELEMERYRRWRTGGEFVHFDPMNLFQFFLDYQE
jgi:murein DD-endopeptidase MepM/ murein hydrolase activator NlpD